MSRKGGCITRLTRSFTSIGIQQEKILTLYLLEIIMLSLQEKKEELLALIVINFSLFRVSPRFQGF